MFWGKLTPAKGKEAEIQRHPDVIEMDIKSKDIKIFMYEENKKVNIKLSN